MLYSDKVKENQETNTHSDSKNFKTYQHSLRDINQWLLFQDYWVEWYSNSDELIWRPNI